jgi:ADP-L-glycero-D-manno-heptose 6-epimerase
MADAPCVLVTGGAGFIGSALVWALNRRGLDRILIADVLDHSAKWRNLVPLRFDDCLEAGALPDALARGLLDHVTAVLHMGACSSTTETDSGYLLRNNVNYTVMLAEWALRRGIRFVYASSAATYGSLEGPLSDGAEPMSLRPLNPYGYSKHLFDLYAGRRGYFDHIAGLKYFNVFGPNEQHKGDMRSVVSKAFDQITQTGRVRLFRSYRPEFGDGEQCRDFVYVKDAVRMTLHLLDDPAAHGLFNVGSGHSHTWRELAAAVFTAMDRPVDIEYIDMPDTLRPCYQYATRAMLDRLHDTGYRHSATPLGDAVHDYVTKYLIPDHRLGDEPAGESEPAP